MRNTIITPNPIATSLTDERPNDGYDSLLEFIRGSWDEYAVSSDPIFTTDAENLYDIFLNNLPDEARQHYNCRACRDFVNRYGGLVTIDADGNVTPVMWRYGRVEFFADSTTAVAHAVMHSKITGVFLTPLKKLGVPKTGVWNHMAVDVSRLIRYTDRIKTADQRMAELKQDHEILCNALRKYDIQSINTAINLLIPGSLARSEKFIAQAQWFKSVLYSKDNDTRAQHRNIVWRKVATAPAGYCHIPGSTLGSLLDDIQAGMDYDTIRDRFNKKVDPLNYQRPKAAPSTQNVQRAEKIFAELGLENSLKRRFAKLEEIPTIWRPTADEPKSSAGIFSRVKTKDEKPKTSRIIPPAVTMTWDKFQRTVLPTAKKIEFYVPAGYHSYTAIVTAEDMDAPPIIAWDREDARNPFSWYLYANGSSYTKWNLQRGWTEVTAITNQPNLYTPGNEHHGKSVIFILKDCRDTGSGSLALFPEILRGELREARSTIEAYSRGGQISDVREATACGVMLSPGHRSGVWGTLRVATDTGIQEYKLDRWD